MGQAYGTDSVGETEEGDSFRSGPQGPETRRSNSAGRRAWELPGRCEVMMRVEDKCSGSQGEAGPMELNATAVCSCFCLLREWQG